MTSPQLTVYDPAMCCSTGVCGAEVEPSLIRFAADLDWIGKQGVTVRRFNLAQEPGAFARQNQVRRALQEKGESALPLVIMEGRVLSSGRYPSREELKGWASEGEDAQNLNAQEVGKLEDLGAARPASGIVK